MLDALLGNPLIALFLVVGLGLALGSIKLGGINLGSSGVLFVALGVGSLGYTLPGGVGQLGLVLFVYCVGIGAGGRFFSTLAREGPGLAVLSAIVVVLAAALAWALAKAFGLPNDLAAGLFSGAMTSTPALAAATEALSADERGALVVGYTLAYPFGVIGVVVFVQILPRFLKWDLDRAAKEHAHHDAQSERVEKVIVEVTNPNLFGKKISESGLNALNACQVARSLRDNKLRPLQYDDLFEEGQKLVLVGRVKEVGIAIDYVGRRCDERLEIDTENERRELLVTAPAVVGKTVREISPLRQHGVVITRVGRLGFQFVPNSDTRIEQQDLLTVVGPPEQLSAFSQHVGHRSSRIGETDLLSLSLGLALGIFIGVVQFKFGDLELKLGLAGGPLLTGLILGHFGRLGRLVGFIPRPTRLLLQEFGLVLFLADAGVTGGASVGPTIVEFGLPVLLAGFLLTTIPLLCAIPIARKFFKMSELQSLGGICGAMTSTPALGVLANRTESQIPAISYATSYPLALILMTFFTKGLVALLG